MSISRKRSSSEPAIIPFNTRDNQYILVKVPITDAFITRIQSECIEASLRKKEHENTSSQANFHEFYQYIASCFFNICEKNSVSNVQFIANEKLARIRFSQEMHQWQTNQQILFYYNPSSHQLSKTFFDGSIKVKHISLLFLASGLNIHSQAALMHHKVVKVIQQLANKLSIDPTLIRVRDHQHITYDILSKTKNENHTKEHSLLPIPLRYRQQGVPIKNTNSGMNYAVISLPITNHLLNMVIVDPEATDPYNPLYTFITSAFTQAAKRYNLNNGALIANGLVPIVRYSESEATSVKGELQLLGYNPNENPCGLISKWNANELVDNVYFIFVANKEQSADVQNTHQNYAKFLNQVEQALLLITTELELSPDKDSVIMRFHQHIAYNLS